MKIITNERRKHGKHIALHDIARTGRNRKKHVFVRAPECDHLMAESGMVAWRPMGESPSGWRCWATRGADANVEETVLYETN